jgi:gentisate 1,2-dioxygenase
VYSVVEGRGRVAVGGKVFDIEPKDHFVIPSWQAFSLDADEDLVLFSFSDRPVQTALNILREERLSA